MARKTAGGGRELLRYPVDVLLAALRDSPARLKLLILDVTHLPSDPWLGMFSNQFPHLLEEKLKAVNDSRLWVLADPRDASRIGEEYRKVAVRALRVTPRPRLQVRSPEVVQLRRDGGPATLEIALSAPAWSLSPSRSRST